jgi:hypothetical protein
MKKPSGLIFGFLVAAACAGCSDSSGDLDALCEQSCAKLEECLPGTTCTIAEGGCTEEDRAVNQCIVDATCDKIGACLAPAG